MKKKDIYDRAKTGVKGLDEMLSGGIPRGNLVMITGCPGTGKTILTLQFLIEGAKKGEKSLYISLNEPVENIRKNAARVGLDLEDYEKKGLLNIKGASHLEITDPIGDIAHQVSNFGAQRLVIDPINVLGAYIGSPQKLRKKILDLNETLSMHKCTTLTVSEIREGSTYISAYGIEEFVCDGIIILYYLKKKDTYERAICVRKMRGSQHSKEIRPMKISLGGITVYATEEILGHI